MALTPLPELLRGCRVVLASGSPRRRDILGLTGLQFEVAPSGFPESLPPAAFPSPQAYAVETARGKALAAGRAQRQGRRFLGVLLPALRKPLVVIAADTVVALDGLILEKPKDEDDAVWMLKRLSGRQHSVITGVAVALYPGRDPGRDPRSGDPGADPADPEVLTFWEETRVTFSELTDAAVRDYVASGEPMDKAGAYGIQGRGAALVQRVEGDVLGAAGLPLNRLCRELAAIFPPRPPGDPGLTPWVTPDPARGGPGTTGGGDDGGSDVTAGGGASGVSQGAESAGGGASWLLPGPAPARAPPPARAVSAWFVTRTGFPAGLLEVMDGVTDAEVLFLALRLGLFELLSDTEPRGVAEVAARLGGATAEGAESPESGAESRGPEAPPPARVSALTDACVELGLLQRADGGLLLTPAARRHLCEDGARPLIRYARCLDRGGRGAVRRALGPGQAPPSPDPDPDAEAAELELEALMADEVLATFDLRPWRVMAQVGGGSLARLLARATPGARLLTPDPDPGRDPLPPADLYVLRGGPGPGDPGDPGDLGDLGDLLGRAAAALGPGGAVLLARGPAHRPPLLTPPTPLTSDPALRARLRGLGFEVLGVAAPGRLPAAMLAARATPDPAVTPVTPP